MAQPQHDDDTGCPRCLCLGSVPQGCRFSCCDLYVERVQSSRVRCRDPPAIPCTPTPLPHPGPCSDAQQMYQVEKEGPALYKGPLGAGSWGTLLEVWPFLSPTSLSAPRAPCCFKNIVPGRRESLQQTTCINWKSYVRFLVPGFPRNMFPSLPSVTQSHGYQPLKKPQTVLVVFEETGYQLVFGGNSKVREF